MYKEKEIKSLSVEVLYKGDRYVFKYRMNHLIFEDQKVELSCEKNGKTYNWTERETINKKEIVLALALIGTRNKAKKKNDPSTVIETEEFTKEITAWIVDGPFDGFDEKSQMENITEKVLDRANLNEENVLGLLELVNKERELKWLM